MSLPPDFKKKPLRSPPHDANHVPYANNQLYCTSLARLLQPNQERWASAHPLLPYWFPDDYIHILEN
jgi:hypothetical protein